MCGTNMVAINQVTENMIRDLTEIIEKTTEEDLEYPHKILDRYLDKNKLDVSDRVYQGLERFVKIETSARLDALR